MGRPKGSKDLKPRKPRKKHVKVTALKNKKELRKLIHPIKKDFYIDFAKKDKILKNEEHLRFLIKFNDWKDSVVIIGALTLAVFCIAIGLIIKLL